MIGKTISHYKILSKLGSGGMGEVYLADDTKLDRKVALKFLPTDYTSDEDINTRFKREARAAAKLNHPNIITIYEIGEHDDDTYIAMEYLRGESLRDVIKEGQLSVDRVTDIASQICEGLSEAHNAGIVHRDIKPENILIDKSGRVKILDFGLAMVKGASKLTKAASTLGTLKYMSPEQYKNEEIDNRSDIFSFGVILFEMLTGELPFQGEYQAAIMYSVVNEQPKPIKLLRPDTPQNLEQVVNKTLEKNPANRYQSMKEVLTELKKTSIITAKEPEEEKSIIVLPFVNMSPDPEQEYFSDGLTEEIITDLSYIHTLRVISRTSAMMLKGTKKDMKTIGRELNVQYVLEGSVRKAGNNLRITAQLIDATTDAHLWAEKYSGTLDDVFDIQEKVSRSIVDALKVKLSPEENKQIAVRPIDNAQAYDLHLRAHYEIYLGAEKNLVRALHFIESGLQIIGENEILYADMGNVYISYLEFGIKDDESLFIKAEECANKVFALNSESSHGYQLKGNIYRNQGKIQESIEEYIKAIERDPNYAFALVCLSWIYCHSGKGNTARSLIKKALAIDPLTPINHMIAGWIDKYEGNFKKGLGPVKNCYNMDTKNPFFRYWYAKGLTYNNYYEEAFEIFDLIEKDSPETIFCILGIFLKYALKGNRQKALNAFPEEFRKKAQNDEIFPLCVAESYAIIKEKEEAIKWLEIGADRGFINYPFLNEYDPFLENIRGEERFKKLMERVKHEWESFSV